ncbi:MAG: drug/metabolite transporter (DMT)-like permease [Candidatus Midichloriaceae bacterium]|jgi:drug/metabolite transporter (DMT)-like permease
MKNKNMVTGIWYMILNSMSLALIYVFMKRLSYSFDTSQVVFFYKFCCFIIVLPWVFSKGISILKTPQLKLHILRGFFSAAGSLFFMYSLQFVKVANATALSYLEQVLWTIIALIFFQEKFSFSKISAILISFIGALAVIYPGLVQSSYPFFNVNIIFIQEYNEYYTYVFLAIISWTANSVSVKILGKKAKNKTQAFYALLFSSIFSSFVAFVNWKKVELSFLTIMMPYKLVPLTNINFEASHVMFFIVITICYVIHSIAFFKAMQKANMSTLAPYHYIKIVFVGILSYLIFGQTLDSNVYAGYLMIIVSGVFLIRHEKNIQKKTLVEDK